MEQYIGLSGVITCPTEQHIMIKSLQADVLDASSTDVLVTLTGSEGTTYSFNAITPVVTELKYKVNEDITVSYAGAVNNVVLRYITLGDTTSYMQADPSRVNRNLPGKWDVN